MLKKLKGEYGTLPAGCYQVNISSESMLKELLSLGVPVNCELSLYGFKRVVQSGDNPYINTVISECLTYDNKVITGTASRVITSFVAPKGKDTTLVLDYGKSIGITAAELKKIITIASGSSITVGNCVGLSTGSAYSGQLLKARPSTIMKYTGDYGAFSYSSSTITYTPNKLLEGTDSVFAVFNITGCSVTEGLTALTAGAMFVDTKEFTDSANGGGNSTGSAIQISEHRAVSAATYEKAGPKNEVYLYPGQAIAFKLEFVNGKIPDRIDVGAKTIMGDKATLAAGFVGAAKTDSSTLKNLTPIAENIVTSTAMYYTLDVSKLSANKDNYLVIYNAYNAGSYSAANPTNVLSITDLKLAYDSSPTAAVGIESTATEAYLFAVDGRTLEAAAVFMKACSETPIADLLVYGSKAQLFKGYRLNALAASAMTEEQRTYCTDLDTVTFGNTNVVKKEYTKPLLAYEAYQLSAALAGDCNLKLNHSSYTCTADENGNGMGPGTTGVFFDYNNCQLDLTGPEVDGADTICYHGPIFTVGQVFMGS